MKAKEIEWAKNAPEGYSAKLAWLSLYITLDVTVWRLYVNGAEVWSDYDLYRLQSKAQDLINELGEAIYQ